MSEEVNAGSGENPGKMKGIIGFVISLVAILLGGSIMGWLFVAAGFSKGAAAIPIAGIVISVMGMKESKAAGHKNGLGLTGMIISIVAIVWLLMVFAGLSLLAGAADNMQELGNALQNLENVGH
jgi:hypothetical protein